MSIAVTEKFESRRSTKGSPQNNPSAELVYTVRGTTDDLAARSAAESESPATYDGLPRQTVSVEPVGPDHWEATVRYGQSQGGGFPQTGQSVFAFDTGGGTQHITQSKQTISSHAAPGATAPDFKGAIGVTADAVEGVDITVPVYQFSETHYLAASQVTQGYKATLFNLTGKVNNGSWKGFNAGEVLFLGASGSRRGTGADSDWEITFRFAASPNASGLSVGPIGGIGKKGWEYLWVRYADAEDAGSQAIVKRPVAAYVERVYDEGNFSALGI
ncbi:MAG: hypothetical protein JJU33_08345 [Phycisphaerales bacterium]|nr:hypothetical protein [Phycisphaerales bacterium]